MLVYSVTETVDNASRLQHRVVLEICLPPTLKLPPNLQSWLRAWFHFTCEDCFSRLHVLCRAPHRASLWSSPTLRTSASFDECSSWWVRSVSSTRWPSRLSPPTLPPRSTSRLPISAYRVAGSTPPLRQHVATLASLFIHACAAT